MEFLRPDPRRYRVDYDWLWTTPPHNDGSPATLRIHLQAAATPGTGLIGRKRRHVPAGNGPDGLETRIRSWWESLDSDDSGIRGGGGWVAEVYADRGIVDIRSGGEDVADGIEDGAATAFDGIVAGTDLDVRYEQLSRLD